MPACGALPTTQNIHMSLSLYQGIFETNPTRHRVAWCGLKDGNGGQRAWARPGAKQGLFIGMQPCMLLETPACDCTFHVPFYLVDVCL